jgi:hypothetical protein
MPTLRDHVVKVRWVKNYAEAHNHVAVGEVVEETDEYLMLHCRTFHFRRVDAEQSGGLRTGVAMTRVIPWSRIEVIHLLPENTRWDVEYGYDAHGDLVLINEHRTLIGRARDAMD